LRQGRRQVGHRRLGFDQAWKNRVAAGERDGRTCCLEQRATCDHSIPFGRFFYFDAPT
jgi:hypothetical protein